MRASGKATGGRRRAARAHRRPRVSRVALLATLVVVHIGLIGALPALLDRGSGAGPLTASQLLAEPAEAAGEPTSSRAQVNGGSVPSPGVRPAVQPLGPFVPERASGTYAVAAAPEVDIPSEAITYSVSVEKGLPFEVGDFARAVDRTLADPRSWPARTGQPMVRVDGDADLRIVLASPRTTDALCAPLTTEGKVSCRNGEHVVINALRWAQGAPSYDGDVAAYRIYVVNHEVGHGLGNHHAPCTGKGDPAPVMLQQTLGLHGCTANPWPTAAEVR